MNVTEAERMIAQLELEPLIPEGGYFRRSWTSQEVLTDGRPVGTAIYFLLTTDTFSAFHRLKSDELWHFYAGDPVDHWQVRAGETPLCTRLGPHVLEGHVAQLRVPAGVWQAARIAPPRRQHLRGWSLLGCTLSPGWRDEDFQLAKTLAELPFDLAKDHAQLPALVR